MIETGDIQVIIEDGTNANLCQQIAYIKAGKTEIEDAVQEGIGDFNTNATEKTNTFNSNASAKTLAFNQNADSKTAVYDNNASEKLSAYNENATNKLAAYNANDTAKTEAYNLNATNKTTAFNNNASEKTSTFNDNAIAKTSGFNSNASSKTTAFNDNYTAKKALIDAEVQVAKDWATKTNGTVDGSEYSAKHYAEQTASLLNTKQDTLVSGTNIKTVNNNSLLGSGNINIDSLPSQTGQSGKFLTTNGSSASWDSVPSSLFIAIYNSTSFSDIVTAYNAGKQVICSYSGIIYYLRFVSASEAIFFSVNRTGLYMAYVTSSNVWSDENTDIPTVTDTYSATSSEGMSGKAVASAISGKANVGLDNLNADGQMIIDSHNGTISNCILEIPQDIKLEISSGNLVLKSGSKITTGDGTQYTTTSDFTQSVGSPTGQRIVLVTKAINSETIEFLVGVNGVNIVSGATAPTVTAQTAYWYDTTNMVIKRTMDTGTTWNTIAGVDICLPIALVTFNAGMAVSIDKVFNGFGYMGGVVFALPNIELLLSNKFDTDGSLKSLKVVTSSLKVMEVVSAKESFAVTSQGVLDGAGYVGNYAYIEVNEVPSTNISPYVYNKKSNVFYRWYGFLSKYVNVEMCYCFSTTKSGDVVTDLTIRQPVRLATTEMLDKVQDQVDTNTTAISGKQVDVTTLTGYDATQTQTLKNINGVLTWVTD